jgi:parvulin-like peptidyl-prolyl isomerase
VQEAQKKGITVGEDEVNRYLSEWMPRDSLVEPGFPEYIYQFLLTQKVLKEEAASNLNVTLRELQQYYEEHSDEFRVGDLARVLEILTESRVEAERIRAEVKDGDLSQFKQLAQDHSIGVTAQSGGSLGVYERGELPEEFEKVIFALKPGEVSEPFRSDYGYHLFAMEEWVPAHEEKFYEVRDEIFERLASEKERQAVDEYISKLFKSAQIDILKDNLRFDRVERQVNEITQ